MAEQAWEIVRLQEDLTNPDDERWLITYSVPAEYATNGVYSYSFPKSMFNSYAAVFGYDANDPEQVEDLFEHVLQWAHTGEVLRREGSSADVDPFAVTAGQARAAVKANIERARKALPVVERQSAVVAARGAASAEVGSVLDAIRADMLSRLDPEAIAVQQQAVQRARESTVKALRGGSA